MKIHSYLIFALTSLMLVACGGDDDTTDDDVDAVGLSFPLAEGNYWTYNNVDQMGTTRDSLYVSSMNMGNGDATAQMDAKQPSNGFMVTLLAESTVATNETQLKVTGSIGAPVDGFPNIVIPFSDMILYDYNVDSVDAVLSTTTGVLEETVEGIPLEITYVVSTRHKALAIGDDLINGAATYYPETEVVLNLEITAQIEVGGFVIPVPILTPQDVLVANNRYEQRVGLTLSTVSINYELEDLSAFGIDLPFPASDSQTATATLDVYVAN